MRYRLSRVLSLPRPRPIRRPRRGRARRGDPRRRAGDLRPCHPAGVLEWTGGVLETGARLIGRRRTSPGSPPVRPRDGGDDRRGRASRGLGRAGRSGGAGCGRRRWTGRGHGPGRGPGRCPGPDVPRRWLEHATWRRPSSSPGWAGCGVRAVSAGWWRRCRAASGAARRLGSGCSRAGDGRRPRRRPGNHPPGRRAAPGRWWSRTPRPGPRDGAGLPRRHAPRRRLDDSGRAPHGRAHRGGRRHGPGLVSGLFLPSLSGASASSRAVLALLATSRPSGVQRNLLGLGVRGRISGRQYRFPVQYAVASAGLVVVPGHPERKTWWHNVDSTLTPVEVLREGDWGPASARVLVPGDPLRRRARRLPAPWPRTPMAPDQPLVLVRPGVAAIAS